MVANIHSARGALIMFKVSIGSATALVALCSAAFAQPPGITPEMINTTLPLEGAPLAVAGPYQTTSEPTFGKPGLMVFRPTNLDAFPARDSCPSWSGQWRLRHRHLALFGFLVDDRFTWFRRARYGAARRCSAQASESRRPAQRRRLGIRRNRPRRIATERQDRHRPGRRHGPILRRLPSVALGADPRVDTIGVFNSGVQPPNPNAPRPTRMARGSRRRMR